MSVDPDVIRSEPHVEIGTLLERHAELLIERWCRRAVEEQPHAQRTHHAILLDHLPEFLRKLGRSLSETRGPYTDQHRQPASSHGVPTLGIGLVFARSRTRPSNPASGDSRFLRGDARPALELSRNPGDQPGPR